MYYHVYSMMAVRNIILCIYVQQLKRNVLDQ